MIESSKQINGQHQPTHYMKLKRIWTYNQGSSTNQQKNTNPGRTYAKALTQMQSNKVNKKSQFISSLVNKIKNVERPNDKSPSREYIEKKLEHKTFREEKIFKGIEQHIINTNQTKLIKKKITKNEPQMPPLCQISFSKKSELQELRQENLILKEKMSELIVQNEKLKIRFKKYSETLQERCEQIEIKEQELKKKEECLNQRQELIQSQNIKSMQLQKFPKHLNIVQQFEETVFPTQNVQLVKAYQEIKQLKLDKLDIQKKYQHSLNQFRKTKEKDFQKLKKGFANNLKYYKDLLLKVSIKSIPQIKRYQEDTFQTAILQISSADQS